MKPIMTFFENVLYKITKKYFTFKNRLIKYDCQQSKVYYIKMAGKITNLNLVSFTDYFLEIKVITKNSLTTVFLNEYYALKTQLQREKNVWGKCIHYVA